MQQSSIARRAPLAAPLVAALVSLAACSDAAGVGGAGRVALTFMSAAGATSGASRSLAPVANALGPVSDGRHTLDVQSALVTFARLDFDRDAHGDEDDDRDEHDAQPLATEPVSVDLVAAAGQTATLNLTVPPGRYESLEGRVRDIRVRGTYDGKPFDVTIPIEVKFESEFRDALVVKEGEPLRVSVAIDPTMWFRSASGAIVDPSLALVDGNARAQIRVRIRAAFHAFRDENRDGRDDD